MWVFLSIVSLLTRAIFGNLAIDSLSEEARIGDDARQAFETGIKEHQDNLSKTWNMETSTTEENEEQSSLSQPQDTMKLKEDDNLEHAQTSRNTIYNKDTGLDMKIVTKRSEMVSADSWLYLPTKERIGGKLQISLMGDKRIPKFNPWGGKRVSLFGSSSAIRRPIRVPFNSWGGKRGKEYPPWATDAQAKRNKFLFGRNGQRDFSADYGVEGTSEIGTDNRRVPFNNQDGMRTEETTDFHKKQFMLKMKNQVDQNDVHEFVDAKDEFSDGGSVGNIEGGKRVQRKDSKARTRFNSWGGKRDDSNYQTLSRTANETTNDYATEEGSEEPDWFVSMPDKRAQRSQLRKTSFNPWGGKRSSNAYALRLGGDYSGVPAESAFGRNVFFPWGG